VHATSPRSRRVAIIAGYYRFSAAMSAVGLVLSVSLAPMHWGDFWSRVVAHPLAFVLWPVNIATCWWTGELIDQRRRWGAWVAGSSIVVGALASVVAQRGVALATTVVAALGLAAIASIWRELE